MSERITITDVAQHAQVSRTTVSLVLAGDPKISAATAGRVHASISQLGYVYNRAARAMRSGTSSLIGFVLTDIRNPFFAELTMAADHAVSEHGGSLMQGFSYDDPVREAKLVRTLVEHQIGSLVILPTADSTATSLGLTPERYRPPTVQLLRRAPGLDSDFVGIDNELSGRLLGAHLAEHGVRRVHIVGARPNSKLFEQRRLGIAAALGHEISASDVSSDEQDFARYLRDASRAPDCVVTYKDTYTLAVLHSLRDRGLEPGRDVAVASFDNTPLTMDLTPPVTSVDHHAGKLATEAVRLATERAADPLLPHRQILVAPQLVERASTLAWAQ